MNYRKLFLLITFVTIGISYSAEAQTTFDAHVGYSPAQKIGSQEVRVINSVGNCNAAFSATKQAARYTAGIGVTHTMESGFFVKAELEYLYSKTEYEMRDLLVSSERLPTLAYYTSNSTISVPLSVGVRLGSFRVLSGVNANLVAHSMTTLNNLGNFSDNSSSLYVGWHAGLGYDLGKLGLELRYSQDFKNYAQGYSIADKQITLYGNRLRWSILLRYYFG